MKLLTETNVTLLNFSILLLRWTVGIILFGLGSGKVFGWFGLPGLELTVQYYANMGIPEPLAYLSIFTELIGGFLLIVGFLTRPAAFAIMINMLVATIVTLPMGFFTAAANPLSLMVSAVVILLAGPMAYSVDSLLLGRSEVILQRQEPGEAIRIERK
jgi:putative oxidoreductase